MSHDTQAVGFRRLLAGLTRQEKTTALLLLATGAALRLWDLGVHSQWYDEMLVSVHASFPLAYLFDLCWRVEIHPPTFYLLNKFLQAFSASDFFLRLPSALAGLASLPLVGLLGVRLAERMPDGGRLVGLAAMGLACVNPMHIWISRQVRPYALMQAACCLVFLAFFTFLARPGRRAAVRLALANAPVVLLHYIGFILLACQGLALAAVRALRRDGPELRPVLLFGILAMGLAAPVLPFLVSAKWLHASPFLQASDDVALMASKLWFCILKFWNFGYFNGTTLWMLPVAALVLGLAVLWRLDGRTGLASLALLAAFPLLVAASGYTGHMTPVHLSYYLPLIFACQAAAFRTLLPRALRCTWTVLALTGLAGGLFLHQEGRAFYHPDGEVADAWHHQERYKALARFLAANAGPEAFVLVDNAFARQAVDWYLRAMPSRLPGQDLGPGRQKVDLLYLTKTSQPQGNELPAAFQRDVLVPPAFQGEVGRMNLYLLPIARIGHQAWSPASRLTGGPFLPHDLLRSVAGLGGVTLFADEGSYWLSPTEPGREGRADFRFESPEPFPAGEVYLVLEARVARPGNGLTLAASFDGGGSMRLLALDAPHTGRPLFLRARADRPFKAMDVRLSLFVAGDKANRIEGPREQVRVSGLTAYVPTDANRFHSRTLPVAEEGLEAPQPDGQGGMFRWGLDSTRLQAVLKRPGPMELLFDAQSPLPGQKGTVTLNGTPVGEIDLSVGPASGRLELPGREGENAVEIRWLKANTGDDAFAPQDTRPLAVRWSRLCLEASGRQ